VPITKPIKLALLWHMHQPDYREPGSQRLAMPWVRLHGAKDYLDMVQAATEFKRIKVTFNIVPGLLDQIDLYGQGGTDPHLQLSRLPADQTTPSQRAEILGSFFSANPATMIEPYARYRQLFRKAKSVTDDAILPSLFSAEEIRDLQVWSNLVWVDPRYRDEDPIDELFRQGRQFSESQKQRLLDWQLRHLSRIIPVYREALEAGRIEISVSPYYHPILPLLIAAQSALEALPRLTLPRRQFQHPEDAAKQIDTAMDRFEELFGRRPSGMWPSEGSVSQTVADLVAARGIKWLASDEEVLRRSPGASYGESSINPAHVVHELPNGLRLLFRDHGLSDRIGFVYSGWTAARAAADFVGYLHEVRRHTPPEMLDQVVVPVVLDGENAWEFYPDDGTAFLRELYRSLSVDPLIETVTFGEAARLPARPLQSLFAGSWINHNFRIWIGHPEDNAAWDLLAATRDVLEEFTKSHRDYDPQRLAQAWNQIYIAEGSDWFWWYGDEHRGVDNGRFDALFRRHLTAVYDLLGLETPIELLIPIQGPVKTSTPVPPDCLLTPDIDGRLTHFYEWAGAGHYDCLLGSGAMHHTNCLISAIYFAYDHRNVYIRLDFRSEKALESLRGRKILISFNSSRPKVIAIIPDAAGREDEKSAVEYRVADIAELAVERNTILDNGVGRVAFRVIVLDGEEVLERWPAAKDLEFEVSLPGNELFWPSG
jgi:alpha-amylase/alpha-mannosidase (GH57 family)